VSGDLERNRLVGGDSNVSKRYSTTVTFALIATLLLIASRFAPERPAVKDKTLFR
jgi:hypothetical protein